MSPSLRALLHGIIDYAGLFPPANLPLDQAVRNYARYCTEPDSWMLGRFVCPVTELAELINRVQTLQALREVNDQVLMLGGGLPIEIGGEIVGGIGVGGAPGAHLDDACAQAGLDAIGAAPKVPATK